MTLVDKKPRYSLYAVLALAVVFVSLAVVILQNTSVEKGGRGDIPKAICHFWRTDARTIFMNVTIRDTGNKNDVATGIYSACFAELDRSYNK